MGTATLREFPFDPLVECLCVPSCDGKSPRMSTKPSPTEIASVLVLNVVSVTLSDGDGEGGGGGRRGR